MNEAVVVGGLVAYELYKLERARSELYIYDLAVTQSHRKVDAKRRQELLRHLDQIENTVVKIVVPLAFADLFYALRGHISAVRESLLAVLVLVDPSDSEGSAERRECSACAVTPPNANTQVRVIEMPIRDQ